MRRFFRALSPLVLVLPCCTTDERTAGTRAQAPDSAPLRVMTFNVNFGVAADPANIDAVRRGDADLVFLQETTSAAEAAFRERLAEEYPFMLFADCCRAGGLGVLSKYPIVEDHYLPSEVGWFPAWVVTVDTPAGPVQGLNVHLRPPVSDSGSWVGGQFSTPKVREQEIVGFWGALDPNVPTLVAGDFNESAGGRALGDLKRKGLRSALVEVSPRAKTWHWSTRVGEIRSMLDHVVVDDSFAIVDATVVREGVSDHWPVIVDLALPASKAH